MCRASTSYFFLASKTWMAGTSPAMTEYVAALRFSDSAAGRGETRVTIPCPAEPSAASGWPFLRRFIDAESRFAARMERRRATAFVYEFVRFGVKQAWACLFGGAMVALLLATHFWYPPDALLPRYDFLFLAAIALQALLLYFRLETSGRSQGHPGLSRRRHGDGDLQDLGRLLGLSGAVLLPDRRRAAVHRVHVLLHRQLSVPCLDVVAFRIQVCIRRSRISRC